MKQNEITDRLESIESRAFADAATKPFDLAAAAEYLPFQNPTSINSRARA